MIRMVLEITFQNYIPKLNQKHAKLHNLLEIYLK